MNVATSHNQVSLGVLLFDVYIIFCFFFEQQWNLFSSSNKIFLEVPIDVEKEHELKK